MSQATSSWLAIAVQLGFVFGALISALFNIADRVTPRRLVLLGALGAAAANASALAADSVGTGLPLRFAVGHLPRRGLSPALKAMSAWFRHRRGFALGVMVGALTLGSRFPTSSAAWAAPRGRR